MNNGSAGAVSIAITVESGRHNLMVSLPDEACRILWLAGSSLVQRADAHVIMTIEAFLKKAEPTEIERARPEAKRVLELIADTAGDEKVREMATQLTDEIS